MTDFLSFLATERNCAASTQNQALNAILFLYRNVLEIELPWLDQVVRAKRPQRVPVVLNTAEIQSIILQLPPPYDLIVKLLYGSGLRVGEAAGLRIKDVDLERRSITVRDGKGSKDRVTVLADRCVAPLSEQIERAATVARRDRSRGEGGVILPRALIRKYPNASFEEAWMYVFPARLLSRVPRTGRIARYHLFTSSIQRAIRKAARQTNIQRPVTSHVFRHSFATHLLESGSDIRTIQQLQGTSK